MEVDGSTGPNSKTAKAIEKYQGIIGCYPADGVWGPKTMEKMPMPDKKRLKDIIASMGGPIDKFLHWIGLD